MVFRGAERSSETTQSPPWNWATPPLPSCVSALAFFSAKRKKKETDSHGQTYLVGRLKSMVPKKITGRQKVGVLACLSIHGWCFHRHWIRCIPGIWNPQKADSGGVIWGSDIRLQRKWLHSIVHSLFLFILPLTFYGLLHVRPKLQCQQAHNVSMGKSLFLCVWSICLNHL